MSERGHGERMSVSAGDKPNSSFRIFGLLPEDPKDEALVEISVVNYPFSIYITLENAELMIKSLRATIDKLKVGIEDLKAGLSADEVAEKFKRPLS